MSISNVYPVYVAYLLVRQAEGQSTEYRRELYRAEGQWITIGGSPDPKTGAQHKGGTPVKIDSEGRITAGPKALEGRHIATLSRQAPPVQKRLVFSEPERPQRKARHPIPPGPRRLPDGRIVGHALVTIDDLAADPEQFQYKTEGIDPETGTTAELKEVKVYRPEFGGQLLVWRDPETGTNYVVNGHHRFELAKRSNYRGPIAVYFIDAKSPSEARAIGALANIAEGRGTALDAAKFMRESGLGPEDLQKQGISLRGQIASKAAVLRHLTPGLFRALTIGQLSEAHALAIGTHLWDQPDLQEQLFLDIQKRGRFSVEELEEVAREMRSLSVAAAQKGLFGEEEIRRSYIWEKAYIKAHIKRELNDQLRAFTTVTQKRKASVLEEAGNVIAHEMNIRRKRKLEEAIWIFEIQAASRSPVSQLLNQYAEEIFRNPRAKRTLAQEAAQAILKELGLEAAPSYQSEGPQLL